jgi:hypothetical protein
MSDISKRQSGENEEGTPGQPIAIVGGCRMNNVALVGTVSFLGSGFAHSGCLPLYCQTRRVEKKKIANKKDKNAAQPPSLAIPMRQSMPIKIE